MHLTDRDLILTLSLLIKIITYVALHKYINDVVFVATTVSAGTDIIIVAAGDVFYWCECKCE